MKKLLLLLMVGFMAMAATVAMAQSSARLDGMSQDARLVEDYSLIFPYANKVVQYKNTVDSRLGVAGVADNWYGVLDGKHEKIGVLGIYVYRPWDMGTWLTTVTSLGGANLGYAGGTSSAMVANILTPENKLDLLWGKDMSGGTLGVWINYGDNKPTANNTDTTYTDGNADDAHTNATNVNTASVIGIGLAYGKADLGPFSEADFHASYQTGSFERSVDSTSYSAAGAKTAADTSSVKSDGISRIMVGALLQHDMDENNNLRVFIDATLGTLDAVLAEQFDGNGDGSITSNAADRKGDVTAKNSATDITLGLGCNHKVNDGAALISGGLKVNISSSSAEITGTQQNGGVATATLLAYGTDKSEASNMSVPVYLSVEGKLLKWLTLRTGVSKALFAANKTTATNYLDPNATVTANTDTSVTETKSTVTGALTYNSGLSVAYKNWTLDGVIAAGTMEAKLRSGDAGAGLLYAPGTVVTLTTLDLRYKF